MGDEYPTMAAEEQHLRAEALDGLKRKRDFLNHVLVFGVVIASLWAIWATTGFGFPWPIFPMALWGVGVVGHGSDAYRRPFSDEEVDEEMQRLRERR